MVLDLLTMTEGSSCAVFPDWLLEQSQLYIISPALIGDLLMWCHNAEQSGGENDECVSLTLNKQVFVDLWETQPVLLGRRCRHCNDIGISSKLAAQIVITDVKDSIGTEGKCRNVILNSYHEQ